MPDEAKQDERWIEGYIIRYNSPSKPFDLQGGRKVWEQFAPGAFSDSVAAINAGAYAIKANVEHEDTALLQLGTTHNNLQLEDRVDGVYVRLRVLADSVSQDVWSKVKDLLVDGASVEFKKYPGEEPDYQKINGGYLKTFRRAVLSGFAITANPQYAEAKVYARSIDKSEIDVIAAEVAAVERRHLLELEAWLYGVR